MKKKTTSRLPLPLWAQILLPLLVAVLCAGILLLGTFISAVSQVILKKAALKEYSSPIREYLNFPVIFAYSLFILTTLMCIFAYQVVPLSYGPVLESTSYLYVTLFGVLIFKEKGGRAGVDLGRHRGVLLRRVAREWHVSAAGRAPARGGADGKRSAAVEDGCEARGVGRKPCARG